MKKYNILYISGFGDIVGGGEVSLLGLLSRIDVSRFVPSVVCPAEGELAEEIRKLGIEVSIISMPRLKWGNPVFFFTLPLRPDKAHACQEYIPGPRQRVPVRGLRRHRMPYHRGPYDMACEDTGVGRPPGQAFVVAVRRNNSELRRRERPLHLAEGPQQAGNSVQWHRP